MIIRRIALCFLLMATAAMPASAQTRTDELMWECEGVAAVPANGIAFCIGYLSGITDYNSMMKQLVGSSPFCLPPQGVSRDQVRLVFVEWAREHPDELHESARSSVMLALMEAFPCSP